MNAGKRPRRNERRKAREQKRGRVNFYQSPPSRDSHIAASETIKRCTA